MTDWKNGFKAERKAEWSEIAQAIHDTVTMDDVIKFYLPGVNPRMHRIPCPIHNGKDPNFSYTRNGYKCFVCGASGDVISFVKETQGCATRADAMRRMNSDLRLGLPIDEEENKFFRYQQNKRREEAEKKQAEIDAWEENYTRLWDEYVALDLVILFSTDICAVAQAKERQAIVAYRIATMPCRPK